MDHKDDWTDETFSEIQHGDKVWFQTSQGQTHSGKAVMKNDIGGWVLNTGGKHGTPQLVGDGWNYLGHKKLNEVR
tara:strand:- start:115 stop:339 length:225 start_codon:yes stop_codon:yes gene_type:complete